MFQVDILFYKVKPPVLGMGHILLSHWTKATHETHPHHQISKATVKVMLTLHNLMVRPYC